MNDLLAALLLGIIEGITEFLPISSTGHLLIAQHWLGQRSDLFNVAIQAGAILAVVLIYWKRLWGMLVAFAGHDAPSPYDPLGITATPAQSRDYAFKLLAAFAVTAAGGLLVKQLGWELPDTVRPIAWALIIGAFWMVIAEHLAAKRAAREGEPRTGLTVLGVTRPADRRQGGVVFVPPENECQSAIAAFVDQKSEASSPPDHYLERSSNHPSHAATG